MATTRASRRKKVSLHEEPNSLAESSPPVVKTSRKHHTRRHNENNSEEEIKDIGKFVKYPQDSPINKTAQSEIEHKSTRKTRSALVSKESNIFEADGHDGLDEKKEEPVKQSRNTRSRKNVQVDVTYGVTITKEESGRTESPIMKKKSKNNKRKVLERSNAIDGDTDHLKVKLLNDSKESCENSSDSDHTRKNKRKDKSRKRAIEMELDDFKEKQDSKRDIVKTAGSFNKDIPQKSLEATFTSINTSADSFHSAAGSPARGCLEPQNREASLKFDKTLDITYDKDSINSTITITSDNNDSIVNGAFQKKVSYSTNKALLSKRLSDSNQKHCIHKSSTPNSTIEKLPGKNDATAEVGQGAKLNTTYDKSPERRSSHVSNQDGNGKMSEDIFNPTVVLIDCLVNISKNSVNDSIISKSQKLTPSTLPAKIQKSEITPNIIETPQVSATSNNDDIPNNSVAITTPKLVREGTFTMESPKILEESVSPSEALPSANGSTDNIVTPAKIKASIPAPGSTPYHSRRRNTRTMEKSVSVLNVTRSIEKEKSSLKRSSSTAAARPPKVMFCSPVWNEVRDMERKSCIIKSSMKGSNKSFVIEEPGPAMPASTSRKRSYTQSDAEDINAKRKKLSGDELANSVSRLSRSKPPSSEKLNQSGSKTPVTPTRNRTLTPGRSKSETKPTSVRSKLPDFAAVHKRAFDRMESLSECQETLNVTGKLQERKAQRAKQMLQFPPTGLYTLDGRRSPKVASIPAPKAMPEKEERKEAAPTTVRAPLAKAAEKPNRTYTRFGFKLQTDFNPFSIPSDKPAKNIMPSKDKSNLTVLHQIKSNNAVAQAKLNITVPSVRREKSKQTLIREKSSTVITENRKKENRDILKGVRTNRRFELQMKSRNMKM